MASTFTVTRANSGFVEVLVADITGQLFGYRLVGAKSGPQLLVGGNCDMARTLFERLLSIPTLPWMRGNLILLHFDVFEGASGDLSAVSGLGPIDRHLVLTAGNADVDETILRANYHRVLRTAANMGMIAGRGVAD